MGRGGGSGRQGVGRKVGNGDWDRGGGGFWAGRGEGGAGTEADGERGGGFGRAAGRGRAERGRRGCYLLFLKDVAAESEAQAKQAGDKVVRAAHVNKVVQVGRHTLMRSPVALQPAPDRLVV